MLLQIISEFFTVFFTASAGSLSKLSSLRLLVTAVSENKLCVFSAVRVCKQGKTAAL